jgi:raffinose synthase
LVPKTTKGGLVMQLMNEQELVNLLVDDKAVLEGLTLSVMLDNHTKVELKQIETMKNSSTSIMGNEDLTEIIHKFSDDKDEVSLSLRLKISKGFVLAFVDLQLKNQRMQSRHKYLALEGSIVIHVKSLGQVDGLMANYQHKDWWTRPHFSTELLNLPERTQSLLWKKDESYYYLLPVVDKVYRTELVGSEHGMEIKLSSYSGGYDRCQTLAFAIGIGDNPFTLSKNTIGKVLEVLEFPTLVREKKRYPEILDYLGWCSWDAFYHQVSENGIIEKMDELKGKELPVKWVMIDDGWLDVEDNRLCSFEADRQKFPQGLSSTSRKLKEQYGVSWVGVWHTIAGYWGGVHSTLAQRLKDSLYATNSNKYIPHFEVDKGFKFWNEWHSRLSKQGIDFVKVDSQSAVNNFMMHQKSVGEAARGIHAGLEASVGIHFDQCIINCMGMAAENVFNRPISAVSRNSDDFVPGEEISFKEHALQNAYNSYYHGEFYWGDWDMFWTNHEEDVQNAVLRAISGGPIYFSDKVGDTDPSKIWPLILNDGRILRADQPGLPTSDCLFKNPNEETVPLMIWNTVNGAGVVAAFNIHLKGEQVKGTLSPSEVPSLFGEKFAVLDYFNQKVTILGKDETIPLSLEKETAALYLILPLEDVTPVGLMNKYLAPATIKEVYNSGTKFTARLVEGGTFGFVSKKTPKEAFFNNERRPIVMVDDQFFTINCNNCESEAVVEIIFE